MLKRHQDQYQANLPGKNVPQAEYSHCESPVPSIQLRNKTLLTKAATATSAATLALFQIYIV